MADTPSSGQSPKPGSSTSGSGQFGFLTHKLFGKIPVWVVALALVAGYYWYEHYGPGAKKTAAAKPRTITRWRGRGRAPRIIVVRGGGGDGRRHHHHNRQNPATAPARGDTGQQPDQASMAAAPGTSGATYGSGPTAAMDGSVYGGDGAQAQVYVPEQSYAAAQPEGTYVPADTSELDGPYVPAG